ncbi:TonB-dependent receptor [Parapedobacter deserti]|uniref:TonB-dependent receptor n=1 Tax=Parapedobacter deserti TaxID=1912957 RepID=A0ABV7JQ07_9SPHI
MKLSAIFTVIGSLHLSAASYSQTITLEAKEQTLKQVFNTIQKQTGHHVIYNTRFFDDQTKVSVSAKQMPLDTFLDNVLSPLALTYDIRENTILIGRATSPAQPATRGVQPVKALQRSVNGIVNDADANPLEGVTVRLKGSNTVTITGSDGRYSINIPGSEGTLVFSIIGYNTIEHGVGNVSTLNVMMEQSVGGLDEVVVVGYGTQTKENITSSVSTISGAELGKTNSSTFTEGMIGKMPGVQVSQITGVPGSAPSIRVRGTGSITAGNEPLYVIDGFPIDAASLSSFNMSDIESISVLKDASSTSIYGSRGANGVIIVTTKKGVSGQTRIAYNPSYGLQQVSVKLDLMSPEEYVEFALDARNNAWEYLGGNRNDPNSARPALYQISPYLFTPEQWIRTDWQDAIFQTAPAQEHQLSVQGGSEKNLFSISAGYFGQEGVIKSSKFERYSVRANLMNAVSDRVKIETNVNTSFVNNKLVEDQGQFNQGIIGTMINSVGFLGLQNEDGSYPSFQGFGYGVSETRSPMAFINEYDRKNNTFRSVINSSVNYEIIPNLYLKALLGFDYNKTEQNFFMNSFDSFVADNPGHSRFTNPATGSFDYNTSFNWLSENTLNYTFELGSNHKFDVLAGFTAQNAKYNYAYISATNFPNNLVPTLNAGQVSSANTTRAEWSLLSYLGRVNYSYSNRYFATSTIRTDGSSRFGSGNRWGVFPSVSAGWMISNERFFNVRPISSLKLRASYGLSGNNNISNYGFAGLLNYTNYIIGNKQVSGIAPSTMSNSLLGWEKSRQFDVAIEAGLFNNRINLIADVYNKVNTDLLLQVAVPSIVGLTSTLQNIGKVRNRGVELGLNTRNLVGALKWSTDVNISFNRNKVLELGPSGDPIFSTAYSNAGDTHYTEIGKPLGNFYGYVFDGVFQSQEQINSMPHLPTDRPGDPIVKDVNGDGVISADDRTILGNYQPDFTYGMTNSFDYRNFDFSFMVQGVQGSEIMLLNMYQTMSMTGRTNNLGIARNRWRSPEEPGDGKVYKASIDVYGLRRTSSSFYIQDGSYLRIRNISLGYTLPQRVSEHLRISRLRLYATAQNPFTFTNKYLGYNPEVSTSHNSLTPGVDYFNYPLSKSWTFGLNIHF